VNLKIPALRERPADIIELAEHFARKYADSNGLPMRPISAEAHRALKTNRWPGNVRELENTMHRAVLLANGPEIDAEAIRAPDGMRMEPTGPAAQAAQVAEAASRSLVGLTVADVERGLILDTLSHCLGNRTHAANILGISIRTLRNKLNQYAAEGHNVPPPQAGEARYSAA
jgi:DNA-binding NtrC family response regulator